MSREMNALASLAARTNLIPEPRTAARDYMRSADGARESIIWASWSA